MKGVDAGPDLLDAIFDHAVFRVDPQGRVTSWTAAAQRITGYPRDEIVGAPLAKLYDSDDGQPGAAADDLRHAAERGRAQTSGWWLRRDGMPLYVERSLSAIRDAGTLVGYAVVAHDITERRAADDELRQAESRFRAQFEIAPEAILTVDADSGVFVEANDNAAQLFGLARKSLFMLGLADVSPELLPDGRRSDEVAAELLVRAAAGEKPITEWTARRPDGTEVPCELRLVRFPAPGRNLVRASMLDISSRKYAEVLALRSQELAEQNRIIQAASQMKSEFLANMSHELRTPLNAILGFAELMIDGKSGPLNGEQREFLGDILRSGRHLLGLINGVLDLAKVEAGRLELYLETLELETLVHEVTDVLRGIASQKSIVVTCDVAPGAGEMVADASKLRQVLYNYLANALKFTPAGGHVDVRVRPEGEGWVRIEVQDTGIGVRGEDLPKLFMEFRQLDAGSGKRYEGAGLGLALTKRLVELMGGRVGVDSVHGQGSRFHAVLPRQVQPQPHRPAPVHRPVRSTPAVLVIDGDANDRDWLAAVLASAGYDVDTADSGGEALARCRERTYDAITLDVVLPDGSGLELLRRLRAQVATRETPLIVVTAVAESEAAAGFAVSDVLLKPCTREQLLDSLRRVRVGAGSAAKVLVVDDDPAALRWMEKTLAELGCAAICRADAPSGLAAVEAEKPSAVVLDLQMPGMDGFEFLRRLRSTRAGERLPVIVWTVRDLSTAERAELAASAQAIVAKGSGREALLREIERQARAGLAGGGADGG